MASYNVPPALEDLIKNHQALWDSFLEPFELMEPRPTDSNGIVINQSKCPRGFICNATDMANCNKIRGVALLYGFGDIHAGSFCPGGWDNYLNCPSGSYCPDSTRRFECPAGKFCPHKTSQPEISCKNCYAGAKELLRPRYGSILAIVIGVLVILVIIFFFFRRYQNKLYKKLVNLSISTVGDAGDHLSKRVRPKLEQIMQRMEQSLSSSQDDNDSTTDLVASSSNNNKNVKRMTVRARRLFDEIDKEGKGRLEYSELQEVLQLNPYQLKEFQKRINELGASMDDDDDGANTARTISRKCFTKHFVRVLDEVQNLGPTPEEVEALWLSLSKGQDWVAFDDFFDSTLSDFLSDVQINDLIGRFRSLDVMQQTPSMRQSLQPLRSLRQGGGLRTTMRSFRAHDVARSVFVEHYANLLNQVTTTDDPFRHYFSASVMNDMMLEENPASAERENGVDITFQDLCLTVSAGGSKFNVVNHVSGRVKKGTMTALMGGSGAGKTSLLNALCGRAFYGETTGTILVNGHEASIEDYKGATGFVPQDDIVYPDLTVKENLLYSARFRLPRGTPWSDIEDLADFTLASLGLSRVANSLVGDVNRRGVSGGEKKRVNIGLELMARPQVLFLDEPTSGLDSSSAMLVMRSLRMLVEKHGMTVISVIHQPRKFIFDLFDSLVLLGVGGNMVYHGPVSEAESYFGSLKRPYHVPPGESVADWLIDISSGMLEPEDSDEDAEDAEEEDDDGEGTDLSDLVVEDGGVGASGPSGSKIDRAVEQAQERREVLYEGWKTHFDALEKSKSIHYEAPAPSPPPLPPNKPSFGGQLMIQMERNFLLGWRNLRMKVIDTTFILAAVILISFFDGVVQATWGRQPNLEFEDLASGNPLLLIKSMPELFSFALVRAEDLIMFGLQLGVLAAVLLALAATKHITLHRLQFFREAGSGYNVNAYYLALNLSSLVEHTIQVTMAAATAYWLRNSLASFAAYLVAFLMLMWFTVSWALFLPLLVPPANVTMVVGFFMAFFGLLFSGGIDPVTYKTIYSGDNQVLAVCSGFVSVTRYFIEELTVDEQRCLPQQSGFTLQSYAVNFPLPLNSFALIPLAQNSRAVVQRSCNGWYWGVLPSLLVGLTIRFFAGGFLHISNRSKQFKKPLLESLLSNNEKGRHGCFLGTLRNPTFWSILLFVVVFAGLFSLSCWVILYPMGSYGLYDERRIVEGCETSYRMASQYLDLSAAEDVFTALISNTTNSTTTAAPIPNNITGVCEQIYGIGVQLINEVG